MRTTITYRDESAAGSRGDAVELTFPTEQITVRELIRERIYQEVQDFNRGAKVATFKGLVVPTERESSLRQTKSAKRPDINWHDQFDRACEAYERQAVLVLVGDRQTESLDEVITIARGVEVTFLRLVPLVGG